MTTTLPCCPQIILFFFCKKPLQFCTDLGCLGGGQRSTDSWCVPFKRPPQLTSSRQTTVTIQLIPSKRWKVEGRQAAVFVRVSSRSNFKRTNTAFPNARQIASQHSQGRGIPDLMIFIHRHGDVLGFFSAAFFHLLCEA